MKNLESGEGFMSPFEQVVREASAGLESPVTTIAQDAADQFGQLSLFDAASSVQADHALHPLQPPETLAVVAPRGVLQLAQRSNESRFSAVRGSKRLFFGGTAAALLLVVGAAFANSGDDARGESAESVATTTWLEVSQATTTEQPTTKTTFVLSDFGPATTMTVATTTATEMPTTTSELVVETTVPATEATTVVTEPSVVESPYSSIDCSADAVVTVTVGMTTGGIEDYCGISEADMATYNPGLDPNVIVVGQSLNLQPNTAQPVSKTPEKKVKCIAPDTLTTIEAGFRVQSYLAKLGYTPTQIEDLVYRSSLREDYALEVLIAGDKECLPAVSSINPYLEQ